MLIFPVLHGPENLPYLLTFDSRLKENVLRFISNRDSVVGIATGYRLDDRSVGLESRQSHEFSLLHVVQTGSGVHPTSYPMGTGGKAAGV
jgi:hypothetical protein